MCKRVVGAGAAALFRCLVCIILKRWALGPTVFPLDDANRPLSRREKEKQLGREAVSAAALIMVLISFSVGPVASSLSDLILFGDDSHRY